VPLINKSVYYLAFINKDDEEYSAGETVNINFINIFSPQIKIERPDNTADFFQLKDDQNFLSYKRTDPAGIYKIFSGGKIYGVFSVNTDPAESDLKYLTTGDFQEYLKKIKFRGNFIEINRNQNPAEIVLRARFGSELWKYAIAAAIILAILEMAVARSSRNDIADGS
jgi:hypothetical protein